MRKINIAVFVSGGGTNLQALIDAEKSGIIQSGSIKLVVASNDSAYALTRARENGIPAVSVSKKAYGSTAAAEDRLTCLMREYHIDLIVLAGYLSILGEDFVKHFDHRILNIHPSLIPSFCGQGFYGLKVHEAALARGVKVTGATVHFVNEIPDGGDIVLQKAVPVLEGDTPEILQRRVMEQAEWILLPQAVETVAKQLSKEGETV